MLTLLLPAAASKIPRRSGGSRSSSRPSRRRGTGPTHHRQPMVLPPVVLRWSALRATRRNRSCDACVAAGRGRATSMRFWAALLPHALNSQLSASAGFRAQPAREAAYGACEERFLTFGRVEASVQKDTRRTSPGGATKTGLNRTLRRLVHTVTLSEGSLLPKKAAASFASPDEPPTAF